MNSLRRVTIVGVFHDPTSAEQAIAELHRLGFSNDRIGIALRGDAVTRTAAEGTQWETGAATGAVAGGATGTLLGIAVAAGLIPGVGPAVAGGLLGGLIASAATGAVAGGVLGALIGLGVPEEEATYYRNEFEAGRVLVTVRADDRADLARSALRHFGAYDIEDRGTGRTVAATGEFADVEVVPADRPPSAGDVRVTKDVGAERTDLEPGHPRADAARRPNEGVKNASPPAGPPGV
jgi:hypothetical protein